MLGRDYWYRYYATKSDSAAVRSWNTDPAKLADLQQAWDVNCPGGAYDPATHPDAPPIGH